MRSRRDFGANPSRDLCLLGGRDNNNNRLQCGQFVCRGQLIVFAFLSFMMDSSDTNQVSGPLARLAVCSSRALECFGAFESSRVEPSHSNGHFIWPSHPLLCGPNNNALFAGGRKLTGSSHVRAIVEAPKSTLVLGPRDFPSRSN